MKSDTYTDADAGDTSVAQPTTKPSRKRQSKRPDARVLRGTLTPGVGKPGNPGKPTYFKPHYIAMCKRLASAGLTDEEMAAHLGVGNSTFDDWKVRHPELLKVLKVGKVAADERVKRSLYRKAMGYTVKSQRPFVDKEGVEHVVEYVEHVEPDTIAQIFWLKNRQPEQWRDRIDHRIEAITTPFDLKAARERRLDPNRQGVEAPKPVSPWQQPGRLLKLLEYSPTNGKGLFDPPESSGTTNDGDDGT